MKSVATFDFDAEFEIGDDGVARRRSGVVAGAFYSEADGTIPVRYQACRRESWRGAWPLPAAVDAWPSGVADPWLIFIHGPKGCGKTHAATALFRAAVLRWGRGGHWLDWSRLLDRVKESWDNGEHTPEERSVWSRKLLLLDDLGAERATPFSRDFAERVLRHRHSECLPAIITSNVTDLASLEASLDARVVSRLAEQSMIIRMGGGDRRILGLPS